MTINNLSNDRSGFGHFQTRRAMFRDGSGPSMINSNFERQSDYADKGDDDASGLRGTALFRGGTSRVDFRAVAQALMARLDALRARYNNNDSNPSDASNDLSGNGGGGHIHHAHRHGSHHGQWRYSQHNCTSDAPTTTEPPPTPSNDTPSTPTVPTTPPTTTTPPTSTTPSTPPVTTPPTSTTPPTTTTPPIATPSTPPPPTTTVPTPTGPLSSSNSISLGDGPASIFNQTISGTTGIVAGNATHVTSLTVGNVVIRSTNYGIYLGDCENLTLSNVDIACDPNGPDSYSIRGNITHLTSSDSTYRSGIKAFRIYGLEGGSSTRDTIEGDRLMLGGGYADEWGPPGPFHDFTFTDSKIAVNSVEMYNDTNNVVFDGVDFSGTGHISIQAGAHDIIFRNCTNIPEIRLYDASRNRMAWPPDASRNIVITN